MGEDKTRITRGRITSSSSVPLVNIPFRLRILAHVSIKHLSYFKTFTC